MKILIAMVKHETNTFSPIVTDWQRFTDWGAQTGEDVVRAYAGTAMPVGAYLKLAREYGAEVVTPIAAEAMPSGPVTADAYRRLTEPILEAVARGTFDAALLDLHGAMTADGAPDGEGLLLENIRRLAPRLPIAVTCDLHCNLTQAMVDNCTALIGYKTYPHTDMHVVAEQVGRIVLDSLSGRVKPVMAWRQVPLLSQTLCQGTDDEPMKGLIATARELERDGLLAATVFGGFALADVAHAGTSVITIADGDAARAEAGAQRLCDQAWAAREDFIYRHRPLTDAVAAAKQEAVAPVILLDHADNCGSGGTQDVMTVIAEVLRQGLGDVAVAAVLDPDAVRLMLAAGVGATLTLDLGGKTDMPAFDEVGQPLRLTGRVRTVTDGDWVVHGPMYTGVQVHMGPTAVFETGNNVRIVVVSRHHEPWDEGVFTSVGIVPAQQKYLLLKSRIHYRAGFAHLARATYTLDGTGVTTSDNGKLEYRNVRRPVHPLDRINEG
jgi:microcystin degradation protein MlrC